MLCALGGLGARAAFLYLPRCFRLRLREVQNPQNFPFIFFKNPPAREKEKEWKILRFLKPVANWRRSRRIQENQIEFWKKVRAQS